MPSASFLAHDTASNQRDALNRSGYITQRVHALVGRGNIFGLSDEVQGCVFAAPVRIVQDPDVRLKPVMDSNLSSVPPLWPSPRPDIMGYRNTAGRHDGRQNQREFYRPRPLLNAYLLWYPGTSDKSTTMPGMQHRGGKVGRFTVIQPLRKNCHEQGTDLIIGQFNHGCML